MKKVIAVCALLGLIAALGSCCLITTNKSPIYTYPKFKSGYAVIIQESGARFGLFSIHPRYSLRISQNRGLTGHDFDVTLLNADEDIRAYLAQGRVVENAEGITFSQPSGHSVFVPRQWYVGGR